MIKYKDKAKIFVKFLSLLFKEMHVYIMGDDFLYLFFFNFLFFSYCCICLFPKWLKEQEHSYLSLLGVLALITIFLLLLRR